MMTEFSGPVHLRDDLLRAHAGRCEHGGMHVRVARWLLPACCWPPYAPRRTRTRRQSA